MRDVLADSREMVQADLWGNATDLSLLVDLNYADLQKLQAIGAAAHREQAAHILRDDLPRVWELLKTVKGGRVDIVMDNGGSARLSMETR